MTTEEPTPHLKNMLTRTLKNYQITLTGNPAEVAQEVLRLNNFGIISRTSEEDFRYSGGIPRDYREGEDEEVTLSSYKDRFLKGMLSLAESQMCVSHPFVIPQGKGFKRVKRLTSRWKMAVAIRAANLIRSMFTK